jgi:flagellar assembly protein FliH
LGTAATTPDFGHFEIYEYEEEPDPTHGATWEGWGEPEEPTAAETGPSHDHGRAAVEAAARFDFDKRLTEEARRAFEAGRERGIQEGRQAEHAAQSAVLAAAAELRTRQAGELLESFARERDRFLQAAEREVVELALAVATRILRREAQMDPLLLTGAVRVALGQLSATTQAKLRVPAAELDLWREAIALIPNLAVKPTVIADEGMRLGDCVIETELGSVDLGIRSQLGEIERGFFDRAAGSRSAPVDDEAGVAAASAAENRR